MGVWLSSFFRQAKSRILVAFLCLGTLLNGCTLIPGMSSNMATKPYANQTLQKSSEASGNRTEDAKVDFDLYKISPTLLQELKEKERLERQAATKVFISQQASPVYRLGPQDSLRIFVWGNPDLSPVITTATATNVASTPVGRTLNENGDLFFPLVGNIHAAGLTISQFRELLTQKLSKYIKDPQIDVDVAGFRSQKIFVTGEVKLPGIVPITDQPLRITDAIGLVGGLTTEADLYDVVLTRGKESIQINLDNLYFQGNTLSNILLQNGDVIAVPDRNARKVFLLGEVGTSAGINQSRSYVMRRGVVTLTEVLSDAGGVNPFSGAASKIYVVRTENEKVQVYHLDGRDPTSLVLAENFKMNPRDIVFVSPTDVTEIGRFIAQLIPITSTAQTVKNTPF